MKDNKENLTPEEVDAELEKRGFTARHEARYLWIGVDKSICRIERILFAIGIAMPIMIALGAAIVITYLGR